MLSDSPIDDAGLATLPDLKHLEHILLERTRVTDAGLPTLARFTTLKLIDLTDCPATNAGLRRLQEALPGCRIVPTPKGDEESGSTRP